MWSHHYPPTLLQLCPTFVASTARYQKGSKPQHTYHRQGRGRWGQMKNLAVTPRGLGMGRDGADGGHGARSRAAGRWQVQWLLLACLLPALGTSMFRAVCVRQPWDEQGFEQFISCLWLQGCRLVTPLLTHSNASCRVFSITACLAAKLVWPF